VCSVHTKLLLSLPERRHLCFYEASPYFPFPPRASSIPIAVRDFSSENFSKFMSKSSNLVPISIRRRSVFLKEKGCFTMLHGFILRLRSFLPFFSSRSLIGVSYRQRKLIEEFNRNLGSTSVGEVSKITNVDRVRNADATREFYFNTNR